MSAAGSVFIICHVDGLSAMSCYDLPLQAMRGGQVVHGLYLAPGTVRSPMGGRTVSAGE
jgi:hypothetical protein